MKAVFKHELSTLFTTMTGYVAIAFTLVFAGIYTVLICLINALPEYEYVFGSTGFIFMVVVPILTMRSMAEERKQRTDQLLYSLPISMTKIVLGKFLALMVVLLVTALIMLVYPLLLAKYGMVNFTASASGAFAFVLMGGAYLSIGVFISCLTENQLIAAGVSFVVLLVNYYLPSIASMIDSTAIVSLGAFCAIALLIGVVVYLVTKNIYAGVLSGLALVMICVILYAENNQLFAGLFPAFLKKLSINEYYNDFMYQSFNIPNLIFFLSVSAIFLYLSIQSLERRRWN